MDNNDIRELTSCMSSICTFNLSNFLKNDFENTSVLLYNYLKKTKHYFDILRYIINTLETQHFFVLNGYKIFVANKYLFKLVLLMSIKHDKDIFDKKCKSVKLENIEDIIHLIIESYSANIHFIPVLRILDSLLKKYKNIIRHELCLDTFIFAQRISLCPIEGFKYYSQVISKHMLPYINSEYVNLFFDITFLPLRGLETSELIPFFSKKCNNEEFTKSLVFKVLNMFANNLESREGGFLYKAIMFMHFDDWKRLVWPHFYPKLISIDFEGEFFQSILKYWIPITLNTYKLDFYNYIYETSVPLCIKGQILLEIKSKTCFVGYSSKMVLNLNSLIMNKTYRFLGLQILSTFHKRTTYPVKDELQLFKLFLYSQMSELDNDHVKYVWRFLSHLSIVLMNMQSTNNVLDVNNFMIYLYMTFLKNIFNFASDLLNSGRPEFGAQILNIFWKLSQGEYNVRYKYISLSNCTMALDEMSYVKLSETIENLLRKSNFNYIEVTNFAYHISNYMKFDSDYLLGFLNINKDCISIKTSEAVKNLAKIVVSKNSIDDNKQLYYKLQSEAKIILSELFCGDLFILENIFKEVLLFDILLEIVKCKIQIDPLYYQEIIGSCIPVVTHMSKLSASEKIHTRLQIKDQVINDTNFEHMINSKTKKIMEAFLNNILQFIMDTLNYVDLKSVITFLSSIIESSNMRKPTTTSAQVLILASEKKYDDYTKNTDLENFKMLLLSEVLSKLLEVPSAQQLTIRRNPESRLIVHALCVSDKSAHKTTLKWVFRELLNILSNDHKDSTLSSSLNCVETLISDNTLYNDTFEFIPEVFLICVKMFDQKSWTVRNANIQLAKALIERFHGVLVGYNNRPKSIDDLFNIFPNLAVPFFQTLSKNPLTDSAIIVMQFFSESQFTKKVFDDDSLATIRNSFLRLFIQIIKNNSNHYGIFAVRSYVSLCIEEDIPIIIQGIVNYIIENMIFIRQNHILTNFILLLNELYYKYKVYIKTLPKLPIDICLIQKSFENIKKHFSHFNSKQFDLLLVKIQPVKNALNIINDSTLKISDWDHRLWQHNYLPYICLHCKENEIAVFLETILSHPVLDCIQIKILQILFDRFCANQFSKNTVKSIIQCLIKKMFEVEYTKSYLLLCYFKVIFCFIKNCVKRNYQHLLICIRKLYESCDCLYKLFVVVLLLPQSELEDSDKLVFKQTIKTLKELKIHDIETAKMISEMLPFLFKATFCICDKYFLFKVAVFLIMEYDLWDFVQFVSNCDFPTASFALVNILDYKTLLNNFKDPSVTLKFVTEVFQYVNQATDTLENRTYLTYYVEEENSYVDRSTVNKIVLKFLFDYNKATSNDEWFEYYKTVTKDNKK